MGLTKAYKDRVKDYQERVNSCELELNELMVEKARVTLALRDAKRALDIAMWGLCVGCLVRRQVCGRLVLITGMGSKHIKGRLVTTSGDISKNTTVFTDLGRFNCRRKFELITRDPDYV